MSLIELKNNIIQVLANTLEDGVDIEKIDVSRASDTAFGDIATNAAMIAARVMGRPPRDVAAKLVAALRAGVPELVKVEIAGPGFINMTVADDELIQFATEAPDYHPEKYREKQVVVEYSDPSSFKVLHAGHLYTSIVGDAIANLVESAGGIVHRVNFGGDVGRHVAMTMWAIVQNLGGEFPDKLSDVPAESRADWMSARYVEGNTAYEDDDSVKAIVVDYNKRIYKIHDDNDRTSDFAKIYWTCRKWSYDYFEQFYGRIGSKFEKYYPESETIPLGIKTVKEETENGVYEKSDGAIVFKGEKYGLHTRVFINSQGLPTYETKDVGLIMEKWNDYHFDASIILTDSSQAEYMAVVLKSIEQFRPELVAATTHITHGQVKLAGGTKMSSRKGNIFRAVDVLELAADANIFATGKDDDRVVLGAVKYAFLKQRIGGDIIYVPEESVSLEGNSGPYLQYAHARAQSILRKSNVKPVKSAKNVTAGERLLADKIAEYPDVVLKATDELLPHIICTYMYELAQCFNRFYESNRVVGDEREAFRLHLVKMYAQVLRNGLSVLGIAAPDKL